MFVARAYRWITRLDTKTRRRRARAGGRPSAFHPRLELLEDRWLLSTFTVMNAGDSALRQAIGQAHSGDTIQFSTNLSGQTITLTGGALVVNKDLTITGLGATHLTVAAGADSPSSVFIITCGAHVSISDLTIAGGRAVNGGGIYNAGDLTLTRSILSGNQAVGSGGSARGGGIFNAGTLTVFASTLVNNQAIGSKGSDGLGGGIFNAQGSTASIANSTLSGNEAVGGACEDGLGGGIYNDGGSLTITNATIAANKAVGGSGYGEGLGGGVFQAGAVFDGDNDADDRGERAQVRNTIIAGNSASSDDPDVSGRFISQGHNLVENPDDSTGFGAAGDLLNVDPRLGPLGDNGGPTPTMALEPGSPAIDAGDNSGIPFTTDQRGFQRFVNNIIEIGAYEFQPAATVTLVSSANPSELGQPVTFQATLGLVPQSNQLTGTITFFDGDTKLGTVPVGSLTVTFETSALSLGNHTITAVYNGDGAFPVSTSVPLTQTVEQDETEVNLASSANLPVLGQPITFTASVTGIFAEAGTPTGTVVFRDGEKTLGSAPLDASGHATFTTSGLAVGGHDITAAYGGDTDFQGNTSAPLEQMVDQADTTTALVSSVNNLSVFGQAVTFTATVTAVAPGAGLPSGMVLFADGNTTLGTGSLDGTGQATFSTAQLSRGAHVITATYEGDTDFGTSSTSLTQTVDQADTTTALVSSVNNLSVFGQAVTFTATVTAVAPGAGLPSGMVLFADGNTTLGTGTLDSTGQATFSTAQLSRGAHAITATYEGDTDFGTSSASLTQTVDQADTTTALVSSVNNLSVFGQAVTFTATVTAVAPGAGLPSGMVLFADGNTTLGTGTLDSTGQATFSTAQLSRGAHAITATYEGDTDFGTSSASLTQTVDQADTTTALVSSVNNLSVFGQAVTFTATVTAVTPGAGTPNGTVVFREGEAVLGSAPLDPSGQATFTTSALAVGGHDIIAAYGGDTDFQVSTSAPLEQMVDQAGTTTMLVSSANTPAFGQVITFTATVTAVAPGAGLPTGMVLFTDRNTPLGKGTLDSNGQATFSTSQLTPGTHAITATYEGDGSFQGSSTERDQTVNQAGTTTMLGSSLPSSKFGQSVTFTATVQAATTGAGTPAGTVIFLDGETILGKSMLNDSGQATFTTSQLPAGSHTITASYEGSSLFQGSSAMLTQAVNRQDTTIGVDSSAQAVNAGLPVTFTVRVVAPAGGVVPSGTVAFSDGAALLATVPLQDGTATFTVSTLASGNHTITAAFSGDADFAPSTSMPFIQGVNAFPPPPVIKAQSGAILRFVPAQTFALPVSQNITVFSPIGPDESFVPVLPPPPVDAAIPNFVGADSQPSVGTAGEPPPKGTVKTTPFKSSAQQTVVPSPSSDSQTTATQTDIEVSKQHNQGQSEDDYDKKKKESGPMPSPPAPSGPPEGLNPGGQSRRGGPQPEFDGPAFPIGFVDLSPDGLAGASPGDKLGSGMAWVGAAVLAGLAYWGIPEEEGKNQRGLPR